ncbi:hypothetical protein NK6_3701 [Bradyrhizobium diazoefficiens]|uniref:Uncharacterized protein n=1 Tax=Bradyrhizobium diazoefficiens TaxID=1355477 RepID=A0A0E4BNS3_9BRAD|nr:hypothetical protein NK6_3701 [Bradyrhizobium diazoefficiens]
MRRNLKKTRLVPVGPSPRHRLLVIPDKRRDAER